MKKGILIQYGIDQKLSYNALKQVMPHLDQLVIDDPRNYVRGIKTNVFEYVELEDKKLFINFRSYLPLFLIMYKNFKSGRDIFYEIEKLKVDRQKLHLDKIYLARKQVELQLSAIDFNKYDFVGKYLIEQSTFLMLIGLFYINKNYPDKKIICGGNWFEVNEVVTKMFLDGNLIDLVIYGDGEILPEVYDKTGEVTYFLDNIDSIPPMPILIHSAMCVSSHWKVNSGCFYATKGCPLKCSFCMQGLHKYRRVTSVETIGEQIERTVKDKGIHSFFCADNVWFKDLVLELDEELGKRNLLGQVRFEHCNIHPTTCLSTDVVKAFKRLNMHPFLGIESFSDRMLKLMNKKTTKEKNLMATSLLDKYEVEYTMGRIFQFPSETPEDFDESVKEYTKIFYHNPNSRWLGTFTLYPLTDIFCNPEKYGIKFIYFSEEVENMVPEFGKYVKQIAKEYVDLADPEDKKFNKYDKKIDTINRHITKILK
jgi:hypothetical protein